MRKLLRFSWKIVVLAVLGVWLLNTNLFLAIPADQQPKLLAHRGVHQAYIGTDRSRDSCHAHPIQEPTHSYIENTIASMKAAFEFGADVVELDVHLTPDPVFAVFHDWTVDCLTNGSGVTEEQPISYLKTLDLGHHYSVDGTTFPLRGQSPEVTPTLTEVFEAGLGGQILINFKSPRADEGTHLAEMLKTPRYRQQVFGVYGGSAVPTNIVLKTHDGLRGYHRRNVKTCFIDYFLVGWFGRVPNSCRDRIMPVPLNYTRYVWGWPHKFTNRMQRAGSEVILLGDYDGSGFSSGIDDLETLQRVPDQFDGYIWTDRIEIVGPALKPYK